MIKYTLNKATLKKFIEHLEHDAKKAGHFRRCTYGSIRYSALDLIEALGMVLETDERSYDAFRRALDCPEYRDAFLRSDSTPPDFESPLQAWMAYRNRIIANQTKIFMTPRRKKKKDEESQYVEQAEIWAAEKSKQKREIQALASRVRKRIKLSAGAKELVSDRFTGLKSLL